MVLVGCTALRQQDFYSGLKMEQENQRLKLEADSHISTERTSEQSNPLCAVDGFSFWGGLMRSSVDSHRKVEGAKASTESVFSYFPTNKIGRGSYLRQRSEG